MGGWWSTVCSLHKTGLLTYHPPIAHRSSWWMEVCWRYIRPQHRWRKLWVDVFVVQTLNIGAELDLATQDSIRMGAKNYDDRYFKGRIAQMQVYDKALTQQQIQVIQQQTEAVGEYERRVKCPVEASKFRVPKWLFSVWCSVFITKF